MKQINFKLLLVGSFALLLAGCTTSSPYDRANLSAPTQLDPVFSNNDNVQSAPLPPLDGQNGDIAQTEVFDPNKDNNMNDNSGDPALANLDNSGGTLVGADGSFVNVDDINNNLITPHGRDLSGSLTVAKLLGTWIVNAEQKTCRLNLTQTTKSGTNRYRASTPNCDIPVLSLTSSWQLTGSQVQLFDASGAIIGAFQRSGNRFVGTLSGGIAASMDG